jgi:hypothetical protein
MTMKMNGTQKTEKIVAYRNRINSDILYTSNMYESRFVDGAEFIQVFQQNTPSNIRRTNWMRKDSLELVKT